MRRTNTKSSRSRTPARRAAPSRTRTSKRARPRGPILTARQAREAAGVVLIGSALLAVVAELIGGGTLLHGLAASLTRAFGYGWPLPVAAALVLGGLWIYPHAPRLRKTDGGVLTRRGWDRAADACAATSDHVVGWDSRSVFRSGREKSHDIRPRPGRARGCAP